MFILRDFFIQEKQKVEKFILKYLRKLNGNRACAPLAGAAHAFTLVRQRGIRQP